MPSWKGVGVPWEGVAVPSWEGVAVPSWEGVGVLWEGVASLKFDAVFISC